MAFGAGNLVVHLMAQTKQFEAGMKRSQRTTSRLRAGIGKLGSGLRMLSGSLLGVAGVGGLGVLIKRNLELMDSTNKVAARIGIQTENLIGLRHAAELTGAGAGKLDAGLQTLAKRLGEAARGSGAATAALDHLGLSAEDLIRMSPDKAFSAIAESIAKVESPMQRAALTSNLFSKGNVELTNTLQLGSDGLAKMQAEAERLGKTFDKDAAAKAELANDSISRFQASVSGAATTLTAELAPGITIVADKLGEIPGHFRSAQAAMLDWLADLAEIEGKIPGLREGMVGKSLSGSFDMKSVLLEGAKFGPIGALRELRQQTADDPFAASSSDLIASLRDQADRRRKGLATATVTAGGSPPPPIADSLSGLGSTADNHFNRLQQAVSSGMLAGADLFRRDDRWTDPFSGQTVGGDSGGLLARLMGGDAIQGMFGGFQDYMQTLRDREPEEAAALGPARYAGAMGKDTREAYSAILAAQGAGRDDVQKRIVENGKAANERLKELRAEMKELVALQREDAAVDIPPM